MELIRVVSVAHRYVDGQRTCVHIVGGKRYPRLATCACTQESESGRRGNLDDMACVMSVRENHEHVEAAVTQMLRTTTELRAPAQ